MADVWQGVPPLGRSPDAGAYAARSRRRRNKLTGLAALGVVVMGAASYGGMRLWDNFTQSLAMFPNFSLKDLDQRLLQEKSGGAAANAAATVASSQPPGSLTVATLNAALPKYHWVDGSTNVPTSPNGTIVGVTLSGTHIETVIQTDPGWCDFGLTITSNADPLIAQYQLLGPGTYYQELYQPQPLQCATDQAPTSEWVSWPNGGPWTVTPNTASLIDDFSWISLMQETEVV